MRRIKVILHIKIINAYDCTDIKNEDPNQYNVVNKSEALDKYGFDWDKFANALGFKKVPDFFITTNLNYIYCMTKILQEEWDNDKWRTYFIFMYIKQLQRFTIEGSQNFFNFQ